MASDGSGLADASLPTGLLCELLWSLEPSLVLSLTVSGVGEVTVGVGSFRFGGHGHPMHGGPRMARARHPSIMRLPDKIFAWHGERGSR